MRRLRDRALALLAALAVALPLGLAHSVQYFCHGMGRLMDDCCCPSAQGKRPLASKQASSRQLSSQRLAFQRLSYQRPCNAKVQSRDCCERIESNAGKATAAHREATRDLSVPPAIAVALPLSVEPSFREVARAHEPIAARAPPLRGPPLFLSHCVFLI